jgi:hypothetical protein
MAGREPLHLNMADHPTAVWVDQPLREAFPGENGLIGADRGSV